MYLPSHIHTLYSRGVPAAGPRAALYSAELAAALHRGTIADLDQTYDALGTYVADLPGHALPLTGAVRYGPVNTCRIQAGQWLGAPTW
jgi:hypothetical protein